MKALVFIHTYTNPCCHRWPEWMFWTAMGINFFLLCITLWAFYKSIKDKR